MVYKGGDGSGGGGRGGGIPTSRAYLLDVDGPKLLHQLELAGLEAARADGGEQVALHARILAEAKRRLPLLLLLLLLLLPPRTGRIRGRLAFGVGRLWGIQVLEASHPLRLCRQPRRQGIYVKRVVATTAATRCCRKKRVPPPSPGDAWQLLADQST